MQLRFEAAVAGVIPVVRVIQESFGATEIEKVFGIVNGTTNYILTEMARDRRLLRGRAGARPGARLRRGRPDRGRQRRRRRGEDGDPRPARLPHRRSTLDEVPYEGIEAIQPDDLAYAKELGLVAEAARRRRAPRRRRQRARLPLLPLRRPPAGAGRGPVQRGHGRGAGDHRGDDVRARAPAAPQTASAVLGDVVSILAGDAPVHETARASCRSSPTSTRPSTCTSRSRTGPACSPRSPRCWATTGSRSRASSSAGIGEDARLVMVMHECLGVALRGGRRGDRQARRSCARRRARSG